MDLKLLALGWFLLMAGIMTSYYSSATIVSDNRELDPRQTLTYSRTLQNYPFGEKVVKINVVIQGGNASFYLLDSANLRLYQSFRTFDAMVSRPNMAGALSTQLTPTNDTIHFIVDNNQGTEKVVVAITAIVDYGLGPIGAITAILGVGVTYFGLSARSKRKKR